MNHWLPGVDALLKKAYLDGLQAGCQLAVAATLLLVSLYLLWRNRE